LRFDGVIRGDGDEGDYKITSRENGATIIFKVDRKNNSGWNWNMNLTTKIELTLPDNTTLRIENTSGDLKIVDYTAENLNVRTTSGDMNLRNVKSICRLKSTSGDLEARDLIGSVSMVSTSGDQEYRSINGNLDAEATSGDMELMKIMGAVQLSATSGDIDIDGLTGSLRVKTTSGEIDGDYITLNNDAYFKSTSGDIHITLKNELDELSFDLRATSGDLRVGGIRGEDNLSFRKGPIMIEGVSTSGDQTYDH